MGKNSQKTYWPHMIMGFLFLAIALSYWTIKAASSMPVQETNDYMMKYQQSDMNINKILKSKQAFDKLYTLSITDVRTMVMTDNIHSNRPQPELIVLNMGANHFKYIVTKRDGTIVDSAKASFLLTRPHSTREDNMIESVPFSDGYYTTPDINISKAGRYTLQFRATVDNLTGYFSVEAYLKPKS
jgi:hypothetical protein